MKRIRCLLMMMVAILVITTMNSYAQDWPQWRGAQRDGISKEKNLNLDWTAKKPSLKWTFRQAGAGFSSPVIVGTTLYCQGALDEKGFAFALDTQTGNLKWKQELGQEYVEDRESIPRGSVTVDGDKLYLMQGNGRIHCLSAADGKIIWQKESKTDLGGNIMSRWGYAESPLIDGNLVICTPGGDEGTMVALDKNTGNLVWRTKEWTGACGHSSVIIAEVGGIRQYIQHARNGVAGISAKDGKVLWKFDLPAYMVRNNMAVIPTPVFQDDYVFFTTAYTVGCTGIKLTKVGDGIKADTIYTGKTIMNQHGGVVLMDGYVYGHSDQAGWTCQNLKTGEVVWSKRNTEGVMRGSVLGVDGHLILLDERTGTTAVIVASTEGWKELGSMPFPERTKISTKDNMVWAHPVIANGNLYLRDHDLLFCFDLKK